MLRPTAKEVYPQRDYLPRIVFDNGEVKVFDVKPYIWGEWYGVSRTRPISARQRRGFTVVWPDGQDLRPDELYQLSKVVL